MCALNGPAWRLQNSLVAPERLGDDEYTAMVCRLVHLATRCFHPKTNKFLGAPHPKMVDHHIRRWMESREPYCKEEKKALSCMVALCASVCSHGSGGNRLTLAPPRHHCGGEIGVWSRKEVASDIARLGMTVAIWSQVDATMARLDA
jgi:hypothetical protein